MAGLCFGSGFLALLEPETKGRELPSTIQEVLDWPRNLSTAERNKLHGSWKTAISHMLGKSHVSSCEPGPDKLDQHCKDIFHTQNENEMIADCTKL